MHEHEYDLQYAIYAMALEKYLGLRSPDRAFNDQFGGVIYLFLRGMTGEPGTGVFFTRPDGHQISEISMRMSHAD
jgi:exodeoxyribonuclease V beta subunit